MVKIHCDRCGAEIEEEYYYTIIIGKADLNPQYDINVLVSAVSAAAYTPEKSPFEELNSQTMYCEKCKNDIEEVINNNGSVVHISETMYKDLLKYKYMYEELCK